jgi:carbamoyltransferase
MNILGISAFYHDAAAALLQDGMLVAAAEEERFSRKKHDSDYPRLAIDFCLRTGGITPADLDYVVFYEKPFVKFERIMMSSLQTYPRSAGVFRESMISWLTDKLWVKNLFCEELDVDAERVLFSDHHLSHAASAFFCSPFERAAVLTVDGVGEWATATAALGEGNNLTIRREMRFPHSLGLLYSAFTAFLGFEVNEGEYKVMGMAPYGRPRYVDKVKKLIDIAPDGSFWLDMDYFSFHHSATRAYSRKFVSLFGEPRAPGLHFFTRSSGYPSYFGAKPADYERQCERNEYYADIAASIQAVTEEVMLKLARATMADTGETRLCMAGGVALNSCANGRIVRETPVTELWVQPAAGDGGAAVGAALYAYHCILGQPRKFVMEHAYWGAEHTEGEVDTFCRTAGVRAEVIDDDDLLCARVAEQIGAGKVVGWVQGRFEWGPRALGARSILADPRRPEMKDIVNTMIKFREPYRPFAPSCLAERTEDFFELPNAMKQHAARFMLLVGPVKGNARELLPAITHVDGSARMQTVHQSASPLYHRLISAVGAVTGVPVVMNTSFNLKGEPIVSSPEDAYRTFSRCNMDALVLGHHLITR